MTFMLYLYDSLPYAPSYEVQDGDCKGLKLLPSDFGRESEAVMLLLPDGTRVSVWSNGTFHVLSKFGNLTVHHFLTVQDSI